MTPEPLLRPFIGITLSKNDYSKVKGFLPTPSYIDTLHSYFNQKIILIYALEGYITSPNQYRWISNIKLGLKGFLFVPFEFVDEFHITDTTEVTNSIYTIDELSKAFKAPVVTYPKIMYPATKQDLYRRLCWYGVRLIHQQVFTKECMIATALLMNKKLDLANRYSNKELHKKALGAYMFMLENKDNFKEKLNKKQLKEAHIKGAVMTNDTQISQTKERITELLKSGDFLKPNGKVNKTSLAKAMNVNRRTLDKYI
ncbi:hypothetical protein ACLHDG_00165 [Sulfurovum sp. CS9]|uniref:hypothetical protein n=1 Tax=Sulfurovum sp. CS9 TaxID=3391146 RepID=UPI0039EB7102